MRREDREARWRRAKGLGRIAYDHVRYCDIEGIVSVAGEKKLKRELDENEFWIQLLSPHGSNARPSEVSVLRVKHRSLSFISDQVHVKKVLEIRWNRVGTFKIICFDPGDWERTVRGWPRSIPF